MEDIESQPMQKHRSRRYFYQLSRAKLAVHQVMRRNVNFSKAFWKVSGCIEEMRVGGRDFAAVSAIGLSRKQQFEAERDMTCI